MNENILDIGTLSVYSIILTSISVSKTGGLISTLGIIFALFLNVISGLADSKNKSYFKTWSRQLSLCCVLSITAVGLTEYLEFYDKLNQSYVHLIPTTTMPMLLPVVVIVVISVFVALGLESSQFLSIIASFIFLFSFGLFCFSAISKISWDLLKSNFDYFSVEKVIYASTFWYSAFTFKSSSFKMIELQNLAIHGSIYFVLIVILSLLPIPESCDGLSFVKPLGIYHTWYQLLQVPAVACSLSLALYLLYLPAVDGFSFVSSASILKKLASSNSSTYKSVTVTGIVCCVLMYCYSNEYLMMLSSSSLLWGHLLSIGLNFISRYQPQKLFKKKNFSLKVYPKASRHIKIASSLTQTHYNELYKNSFNDDSGNSSDTDIDAIVDEYKEKIQILGAFDRKEPTTLTGICATLLFIAILLMSFLISFAFEKGMYLEGTTFIACIIVISLVIYIQPSLKKASILRHFSEVISCVVILILMKRVIVKVWLPLTIWAVTGASLYFLVNYNTSMLGKKFTKNKMNFRFKEVPNMAFKTKSHTVQTVSTVSNVI